MKPLLTSRHDFASTVRLTLGVLCVLGATTACGEKKDSATDDTPAATTDDSTSDTTSDTPDETTTEDTTTAPTGSDTSGTTEPGAGGSPEAACGAAGQDCCAGDTCSTWRLVCSDGKCEDCGRDVGQKCCVDPTHAPCTATPDGAILGCGNGESCELCGEPGQPCCLDENEDGPEDDEYDVCGSTIDHVCDLTTHTCVECGTPGGLCCEYGACNGGTECTGLVAGEANGQCPE